MRKRFETTIQIVFWLCLFPICLPAQAQQTGNVPSQDAGYSIDDAPIVIPPGWLDGSSNPATRANALPPGTVANSRQGRRPRSWIGRHPVLIGAMAGFGAGFLVGYLPGDDGVFYDFTAGFNGFVLGGVGAGAGAVIGYAIGAVRGN